MGDIIHFESKVNQVSDEHEDDSYAPYCMYCNNEKKINELYVDYKDNYICLDCILLSAQQTKGNYEF